jgi:hypothetical protein
MPLQVRWLLRADLLEVSDIQLECVANPLPLKDMIRKANCYGRVVVDHDEIVMAYALYRISRDEVEVLELASHQRLGTEAHERTLLEAVQKTVQKTGKRVLMKVAQQDLARQLLLSKLGFRAVEWGGDVFYIFRYQPAVVPTFSDDKPVREKHARVRR